MICNPRCRSNADGIGLGTIRYRSAYPRRVVKIFKNTWSPRANWIGVRLRGAPGVSPIGASVLVVRPGGRQADAFVTGDSAKCQHAHLKHFGLGADESVEYIEIRWPDGAVQRLDAPAINQYHDLTAASASSGHR